MEFILEKSNSKERIENFLVKNSVKDFYVDTTGQNTKINISEKNLTSIEIEILTRHFSYYDIFLWSEKGVENVILWEKPKRIKDVLSELELFFPKNEYDIVTSIEAKGFILGGILGYECKKPFITIRKYKSIYDSLPGYKKTFTNWKGKEETLYLFYPVELKGSKAILFDDVLDTGNSLMASVELLKNIGVDVMAAFYLYDATSNDIRNQYDFPIRSLLRFNNLFGNTTL